GALGGRRDRRGRRLRGRRTRIAGIRDLAGRGGLAFTLPLVVLAVGDRPYRQDAEDDVRSHLGDRQTGPGRRLGDAAGPKDRLREKADAPPDGDRPEHAPVALVLPEPGHLLARGAARPRELQGETEHERTPRTERAQATQAEYGRRYRPLHQHQPGVV